MSSIGQSLREEREARNISIEEIASSTKIVLRYLEALEADRLDRMPGGFFIRGIIRNYARAIGLDPEEVLNRYKSAGLLEPGAPEKRIFPRPAPRPAPRPEPVEAAPLPAPSAAVPAAATSATTRLAGPTELIGPPPAAGPELAPGTGEPLETEKAAPAVRFDEAPKPRLSAAGRKRVLAWTWRVLTAVLLVAVIVIVWPRGRRDGGRAPSDRVPAGAIIPPPSASAAGTGQPAAKSLPDPIPVVEEAWPGITIEIEFQAQTWIQVRTDGEIKINGIFPPGSTARARADNRLLIHTGNAGGFSFRLNGKPAKPLGRSGHVLSDIKITTENLKDFLEVPIIEAPTG